jgi:hypothetical protein
MIDKRRKKRIKKGNKQSIKEMQIAVEKVVSEADLREKWEELADRLIVYAEEISYQKCDIDNWHEKASKDIEQYEKLKKLTNAH